MGFEPLEVFDVGRRQRGIANEDEELRFWAKRDTTQYFAWEHALQRKLPELRPSIYLAERIASERGRKAS